MYPRRKRIRNRFTQKKVINWSGQMNLTTMVNLMLQVGRTSRALYATKKPNGINRIMPGVKMGCSLLKEERKPDLTQVLKRNPGIGEVTEKMQNILRQA